MFLGRAKELFSHFMDRHFGVFKVAHTHSFRPMSIVATVGFLHSLLNCYMFYYIRYIRRTDVRFHIF